MIALRVLFPKIWGQIYLRNLRHAWLVSCDLRYLNTEDVIETWTAKCSGYHDSYPLEMIGFIKGAFISWSVAQSCCIIKAAVSSLWLNEHGFNEGQVVAEQCFDGF